MIAHETIIQFGRKAWSISIIGKGLQQLYLGNLDAIFLPTALSEAAGKAVILIWGIAFTLSGVLMLLGKKAYEIAFFSGCLFLLFLLFGHVPDLVVKGQAGILLQWAAAIQDFGFAGASFAFAASYWEELKHPVLHYKWTEKLMSLAGVIFSFMLIGYGIVHFVYVEFVARLVPSWIPWSNFWTYFTGTALVSAGLALTLKVKIKLASCLLATMIFLWFLMLHVPRAFLTDGAIQNLEQSRAIVTFGYTGIALLFGFVKKLGVNE